MPLSQTTPGIDEKVEQFLVSSQRSRLHNFKGNWQKNGEQFSTIKTRKNEFPSPFAPLLLLELAAGHYGLMYVNEINVVDIEERTAAFFEPTYV